MKTGMILGIIGGVIALIIGAVGYSASSALGSLSSGVGYSEGASSMQFYSIMSIVLPIAGLVGAGIAGKNAQASAGLMGISAAGILWVFGLGLMSIVPAVLLGIGAFLVVSDGQKGPYEKG